jgi:hypothetical protein
MLFVTGKIFSILPLFPHYFYHICLSETCKIPRSFIFIKEEQVWQCNVHIYLKIYMCVYIYKILF